MYMLKFEKHWFKRISPWESLLPEYELGSILMKAKYYIKIYLYMYVFKVSIF